MTTRILSISSPGGDRGPAVMHRNHIMACRETKEFNIVDLNSHIWSSDEELKKFDVAWGYVRFQPRILQRLRRLQIPVIGGPAIAMESAHDGIKDEYEKWYLTQSDVQVNLNVAKYYSDYVATFVKNGMKCEVLEGCYDTSTFKSTYVEKDIDVLLYDKVRINDSHAKCNERLSSLTSALKDVGLKYEILTYGKYDRKEYIDLCARSKIVAWLSIEDYASLAQIEAHLAGACVVGTPYNLTIPAVADAVCHKSQTMSNWVSWNDTKLFSADYLETIMKVLSIKGLEETVRKNALARHSFQTYRNNLSEIVKKIT